MSNRYGHFVFCACHLGQGFCPLPLIDDSAQTRQRIWVALLSLAFQLALSRCGSRFHKRRGFKADGYDSRVTQVSTLGLLTFEFPPIVVWTLVILKYVVADIMLYSKRFTSAEMSFGRERVLRVGPLWKYPPIVPIKSWDPKSHIFEKGIQNA